MICGGTLWDSYQSDPTEDWLEQVQWKMRELGTNSLGPYQHPPDGRCALHVTQGHLFLRHEDLLFLGYLYLEDGSVVFVNDTFYELDGYSRTTGYWLVEEIDVDGAAEWLHPAMFEPSGGAGGPEA